METSNPVSSQIGKRLNLWNPGRRLLSCIAVGTALLTAFYAEEYWRGKRAWEQCKSELEARGAILDRAALSPPPIADELNFFKAPKMTEWFETRGQNELLDKLSLSDLAASTNLLNNLVLAKVVVVPLEAPVATEQADVVLRYGDSFLALSDFGAGSTNTAAAAPEVIPLIVMDQVPLPDAIRNLARHAGLNYLLDPGLQMGDISNQPMVSLRWENVTAHQALAAMLANYGLRWVHGPQGVGRIMRRDQTLPKVEVEPAARSRMEALITSALEQSGNEAPVRGLLGAQELGLVAQPLKHLKPLRVVVRTDEMLATDQVAQFLWPEAFTPISRDSGCFQARPFTADSFQVFLGPRICCTAADYLAWSDRCQPEFEMIRAALQRPQAQMRGTNQELSRIPLRNFITVRLVAQTLSQRAQCHLLLNQPGAAWQELRMLHDLRRVLTCEPVTLVAAMVNVAVTGLYVNTVADGLRLGAWQEPQLSAIEEQLREINLMPSVVEAVQLERLNQVQTLQTGKVASLLRSMESFSMAPQEPSSLQKLRNARYALLALLPRGWTYQNMATLSFLQQGFLDAIDAPHAVISPRQFDAATARTEEIAQRRRPETFLASALFPNFIRAHQTVAQNQTLVHEAFLACALERHRLVHGQYPDSLEALVPEFATAVPRDVINGQPLHYRRTENNQFLLHSVGWNEADDGGVIRRLQGGSVDIFKGDWVWSTVRWW